MLNEKREFVCDWCCCGKPATRVVNYFVDPPSGARQRDRDTRVSLWTTEAYCDDHAELEEKRVREPGRFVFVERETGEPLEGIVNDVSIETVEDYCYEEKTYEGLTFTRIGKNVDPARCGFPPEARGTVVVCDRNGRQSILHKLD